MSNEHPATVPAALAATQAASTGTLLIDFTGSGSEYFRIWIVNLLLTLVTLGLYFPWAKVRRLRYFYGNTLVDGEPLGFHGSAFKMFKGFAIMALFMGAYAVAGNVSPTAGFIAFLLIAGLWPALLKSSLQFRMANTSWRGLRFGFAGSTQDAYRACLPLFVPGVLILGLFLLAPELQAQNPATPPNTRALLVFALLMVCTLLISPWLMWNLKSYQHSHYRFSSETTRFRVSAKSYYSLSLKTIGVVMLVSVVMAITVAVTFLGIKTLAKAGLPSGPMAAILTGVGALILPILTFTALKPYAVTRFQNLVWNGTRSQHIQLQSRLRVRAMIGLTLKNWLLMLLTLGLYWPFATIAMTRLRLQAVQLESSVSPNTLLVTPTNAEGQAIGEASGDFLGFDIGW